MHTPSKFEQVFAMVLLLVSTGAFMNLFLTRTFNPTKGLPIMEAIWAVLYLVILFLLFTSAQGALALIVKGWPFLLLLAVTVLSVIWSDAKGLTARRSGAVVATTVAGLYLANRYTFAQQLKLLMPILKISTIGSLFFGALQLGTPVDKLPDSWYGIFTQRNALGMIMSLGTLVFLLWSQIEREERYEAYSWAFLSFTLLLLSRSATGILSLGAVLLLFVLLRQIRCNPQTRRRTIVLVLIAIAAAVYYTVDNFASVTELFSRDVTLTGRSVIWGASLLMGMDRPWTGHGFNAFWLGDVGPSGQVRQIAGWDVPGAHNGFLEIWLDLGLLGLTLFLLGFVRDLCKSVQCFLREDGWDGAWPVLFLTFLFFFNLTQSALFSPNFLLWILYVAVSYRLCLAPGEPMKEGVA